MNRIEQMQEKDLIIYMLNHAMDEKQLRTIYHHAVVKFHPDNDASVDVSVIIEITKVYRAILEKGFCKKSDSEKRDVSKPETPKTCKIKRRFSSFNEFSECDGTEQFSVVKGSVVNVATVLCNATPFADNRKITDKHHADNDGNFDGTRTYSYAKWLFNKNGMPNSEKVDDVATEAWIKLNDYANDGKHIGMDFNRLLWVACRNALSNVYYHSVEKANYYSLSDGTFDFETYKTTSPVAWSQNAVINKVWYEQIDYISTFDRKVWTLNNYGYNESEIAVMVGKPQRTISWIIEKVRALIDIQRLEDNGIISDIRSNASATKKRKSLIMQAISNGMSYKRIAYHLHCDISDIKRYLNA